MASAYHVSQALFSGISTGSLNQYVHLQARPDYVVQCVVRDREYADEGELGMTLKKRYFDRRLGPTDLTVYSLEKRRPR